jgi:superfamily II DNA or RNA helicase
MILRPYQNDCASAVTTAWQDYVSALAVLPTGCGKTIIFAEVIRRSFPRRAMVLAHREELIWQARDKIQRVTGLNCEVEMGEFRAAMDGLFGGPSVVVSTIQTHCAGGDGGGRMGKFDPHQFGLLIIDEAHHATSPSYRRVIDYYRTNPNLRVMGVTATPDRTDEEALGQVFDTVAYDYEILDAVHDGWLTPIEQQIVVLEGLDFSHVRTTAGDLNGADLAAVMEFEQNLQGIAGPSLEIIGRKRALVFTASVAHAERLCEIFNRHRSGMAGWVCGKTDRDERRKLLTDFANGAVQVVCNCGVLTEGFDDPGVEVVIMGRPTKSRSLYAQMVGRATRPLPGLVDGVDTADARKRAVAASLKPSCLVVDFVGNSGQHKLVTSADILGGKVSEAAIERAVSEARKAGKPVRMTEALEDAEAETQRLADERRQREAATRARLVARARFSSRAVDPFEVFDISPTHERGWDNGKQLSEKQKGLLLKQGINPEAVNFSQGRQLIAEMFRRWNQNLCSFKQASLLKKHGYDANVSREVASKIIDGLARNGWKRVAA